MAEKTQKYLVVTEGFISADSRKEVPVGSVVELTDKQGKAFVGKVKLKVDADGEGKAGKDLEKAEARIENLVARVKELEAENAALKEAAAAASKKA